MSRQGDPYLKPSEDLNRRLGQLASVFGKLNETGVSKLSPSDRVRLENDLRQHVSNCEWEVGELEEALQQIESNRQKFGFITNSQIQERKAFIQRSKIYLQNIKSRMAGGGSNLGDSSANPPTGQLVDVDIHSQKSEYSSLGGLGAPPPPGPSYTGAIIQEQQTMLRNQDEHLDSIAGGVSLLKDMSQRIGNELDDQDVLLDDLGNDMEHSQRRVDTLLSRTQKVLHLSNDRRQWCVIIVLIVILFIVICLFFV